MYYKYISLKEIYFKDIFPKKIFGFKRGCLKNAQYTSE